MNANIDLCATCRSTLVCSTSGGTSIDTVTLSNGYGDCSTGTDTVFIRVYGHQAGSYTLVTRAGYCSPGYYASSATCTACGGSAYYCIGGTGSVRSDASPGYVTSGGSSSSYHTSQSPCPANKWCRTGAEQGACFGIYCVAGASAYSTELYVASSDHYVCTTCASRTILNSMLDDLGVLQQHVTEWEADLGFVTSSSQLQHAVLIPPLSADMLSNLTDADVTYIRQFVQQGGDLIVMGDNDGYIVDVLNMAFHWSLEHSVETTTSATANLNSNAAVPSEFTTAASSVALTSGSVVAIAEHSLPSSAVAVYQTATSNTWVWTATVGCGAVTMIGHSSLPTAWVGVLGAAIGYARRSNDFCSVIATVTFISDPQHSTRSMQEGSVLQNGRASGFRHAAADLVERGFSVEVLEVDFGGDGEVLRSISGPLNMVIPPQMFGNSSAALSNQVVQAFIEKFDHGSGVVLLGSDTHFETLFARSVGGIKILDSELNASAVTVGDLQLSEVLGTAFETGNTVLAAIGGLHVPSVQAGQCLRPVFATTAAPETFGATNPLWVWTGRLSCGSMTFISFDWTVGGSYKARSEWTDVLTLAVNQTAVVADDFAKGLCSPPKPICVLDPMQPSSWEVFSDDSDPMALEPLWKATVPVCRLALSC